MNKMKGSTLLMIFFLLNINSYSQVWLGKILPIQNNISELAQIVEELPQKNYEGYSFYKLKEGNLLVYYSVGNCVKSSWGKWNVHSGTIISLVFYSNPKKAHSPSFYTFPKKDLIRQFDHGHISYSNLEEGVLYDTEFGKVVGIYYTPAKKYESFRCMD